MRMRLMLIAGLVFVLGLAGSATALEVGQKAPDFTLAGTGGKPVKLADMLGKGPIVVYTARDLVQLVGHTLGQAHGALELVDRLRSFVPLENRGQRASHLLLNTAEFPDRLASLLRQGPQAEGPQAEDPCRKRNRLVAELLEPLPHTLNSVPGVGVSVRDLLRRGGGVICGCVLDLYFVLSLGHSPYPFTPWFSSSSHPSKASSNMARSSTGCAMRTSMLCLA